MKIIRAVSLTNGNTALQLDQVTDSGKKKFMRWAKDMELDDYVEFKPFYVAEMFGDCGRPAIQFKQGYPKGALEWCILKWGEIELESDWDSDD